MNSKEETNYETYSLRLLALRMRSPCVCCPGMAKVSDSREGSSYKDLIFFSLKSRGVATWPNFRY